MPYQGVIFVGPASASLAAIAAETERLLPDAATAHDALQVRARFDDGFTLLIRQVFEDARHSIANEATRSGQLCEAVPEPLATVWEIGGAGIDPAKMHFNDYLGAVAAVRAAHESAAYWNLAPG